MEMTKNVGKSACLVVLLFGLGFLTNQVQAQSSAEHPTPEIPNDWFLKDPESDRLQGVSAERAYNTLLKGRPSRTIIVGVIDSGIDINHEDLKDIIWVNEDEIPGNGIDDDKNGYIDDIYGWSFLGGKNGDNIVYDTYELTREFVRFKRIFGDKTSSQISKKDKMEFDRWIKIKAEFEEKSTEATELYNQYGNLYKNISFANDTLKSILGISRITVQTLDTLRAEAPLLSFCKSAINIVFMNYGDVDVDKTLGDLKEYVDHLEGNALYRYNEEFDPRSIVGDNYANLYEKGYGNNDVTGPDADHGTHVAGIIAANRTNNIGINGIADNVKIMAIRAVPDGDERDKDVANAIIYAVDNGAQIINMSFGKSYSPQKEAVDKAVKYAESKGVLLIHAAGNDGKDLDKEPNYPTRLYDDGKESSTWIEIGASSWGSDNEFVANFSNYSKRKVDFFSPGVEIYSTVPGNKYKHNDGTSMASPAAAGVAAILMSYFPELSATQVRDILRQSSRRFNELMVTRPGSDQNVKFSELSITGGLVNAYEAVKLALSYQTKKPEK
jgi:subtilisin family serine protease